MPALAQALAASQPADPTAAPQAGVSAWSLFVQSVDVFTAVLVAGSVAGVAILYRCLTDIRPSRLLPADELGRLDQLVGSGPVSELAAYVRSRSSFPAHVLRAMLASRDDPAAAREAAQLEADAQCARWLRRIEPLATIGNLAPLVGLAGTVWGMILAFTTIGSRGGVAGPSELSLGISKALFHTLLGLVLAVPALAAYATLRARVDRLCDRAMSLTSAMVERVARRLQDDAGP